MDAATLENMADETSERAVSAGEVVAAQDALATEVSPDPEKKGFPVVLQSLTEGLCLPYFLAGALCRWCSNLVKVSGNRWTDWVYGRASQNLEPCGQRPEAFPA